MGDWRALAMGLRTGRRHTAMRSIVHVCRAPSLSTKERLRGEYGRGFHKRHHMGTPMHWRVAQASGGFMQFVRRGLGAYRRSGLCSSG